MQTTKLKTLSVLSFLLLMSIQSIAQKSEKFDIVTFQSPKGWEKEVNQNAIQFATSKENSVCLITLVKPLPAGSDTRNNFSVSWENLVKEVVTVTGPIEMSDAVSDNGWTIESGFAEYENEGTKGVALLYNYSGGDKMVNVLIFVNSGVFEAEINKFVESISLPKINPVQDLQTKAPVEQTATARKSNFKFNESNFDDGWTSIEQEDWVEVVKGNIKVLIHYPKEGTVFPADPEPLTNAAWNILVAPRYSNLKNYRTAYISTYDRPYLGMGSATDNASGKPKFVLLFRLGNSGWLVFIAPDKNSFIQQFKFDPETIKWDSESDLLLPLLQMTNYNKFAVAESDFTGTWTSDFTGVQQMYNVYTGNYAGMNINQSNEEFVFGAGNTYSWKLLVVNGMVGNMKFANVSSAGKFSVPNNWQIQFSKIESGPKTYSAYWSCIKGARLLNLLDAKNPGSGTYSVYGKK